jgi:hypothetical protein
MQSYLYLSLIPESLIASQLSPEEFGSYYAVGTKKRSRGQAIFFEVEPGFETDYFDWAEMERRCVPHPDGRPKRSAYLAIYRALEHVPLAALKRLYLATDDGRVLGIERGEFVPPTFPRHYLYQELCPITPRIVANLDPAAFARFLTDRTKAVSVAKIAFCDLRLDRLARDPEANGVDDLPYRNLGHLRDCLREIELKPHKNTKAVSRAMQQELLFRTIEHGFFVGSGDELAHYPMPTIEELEREHYEWWRSALNTFGE